ncbi:MAG TPA: DegV family protein [Anaerolineaceae bacterium]|nr:DegV family protein [Anaerolineaceae bacterium]HQH85022.1 DegV family protein [Anaerolineaceae bacterium]
MTVRIVTDSTCDLPADIINKYRISVIPLYINVGSQGYLDGVDITRQEFYQKLPIFPTQPTTAVPSAQKFHSVYTALADEGATDVLSIHISTALSAIHNVAQVAAQEITSTRVTVIDSRQLSLGTGFLVELAARLAEAGHSLEQIVSALNEQIKRTYVFAALDTLEFLRRSGRMNRFLANFGTLLQIKPILRMHDGKPETEKVRTRDRALHRVVEILRSLGALERLAIVHTNAHERVAQLRALAADLLPAEDIWTMDITPVIGAHIGPGAIGFGVVTARS